MFYHGTGSLFLCPIPRTIAWILCEQQECRRCRGQPFDLLSWSVFSGNPSLHPPWIIWENIQIFASFFQGIPFWTALRNLWSTELCIFHVLSDFLRRLAFWSTPPLLNPQTWKNMPISGASSWALSESGGVWPSPQLQSPRAHFLVFFLLLVGFVRPGWSFNPSTSGLACWSSPSFLCWTMSLFRAVLWLTSGWLQNLGFFSLSFCSTANQFMGFSSRPD